jgi:anti-anti-sigma regulatory factor
MSSCEYRHANGQLIVKIQGKIDQYFDGAEVLRAADGARAVVLELGGVRSISSLGVRALEAFMRALGDRDIFLDDISAAVANQVTMIPNLIGRAVVRSARLPFVCSACGAEESHSVPYEANAASAHAPKCSRCGARMDFDGFSEEYLPR